MSVYKKLFGQTAVYGLSSILGRLLNYFLVPLYVRIFSPSDFGVITELYAHITLAVVIYTYGMETAYFRFASKREQDDSVFSTAFISLFISSILLSGILVFNAQWIADALKYPTHPEYIVYIALILGLDAVSAVPFAHLRQQSRAFAFAMIRLFNILVNVVANLYFLVWCPWALLNGLEITVWGYSAEIGIGYVFISNLTASMAMVAVLLLLSADIRWKFSSSLWKEMLIYALPLLPAGLAGMVNESFSRLQLKDLLPYDTEENLRLLGIFGANYRLSMLMTLAIQAYRMAAEPLFFSLNKETDARLQYAKIMNVFVFVCGIIFLGIMMHLDLVQAIFFGSNFTDYVQGLSVVPILLYANLFLGIYFNLSIWYKLIDKTTFGAYISIFGAVVTVGANYLLIPSYGYMGAAWATFICYLLMMFACYVSGQFYYAIPYNVGRIALYLGLAAVLYAIGVGLNSLFPMMPYFLFQIINTSLFMLYILLGYKLEFRKIKLHTT